MPTTGKMARSDPQCHWEPGCRQPSQTSHSSFQANQEIAIIRINPRFIWGEIMPSNHFDKLALRIGAVDPTTNVFLINRAALRTYLIGRFGRLPAGLRD